DYYCDSWDSGGTRGLF
nr:immunoglobulin light chain junction region [Macaca mulatta]MOW72566.1 immunoglobulin light chain junction region [Macaca mulatta]